jgi:hypothetical protein
MIHACSSRVSTYSSERVPGCRGTLALQLWWSWRAFIAGE